MGEAAVARLLRQLAALSPMPNDKALFDDETALADRYDTLIEEISQALTQETLGQTEEEELVAILADSFRLGGGMGIYWATLHLIEKRLSDVTHSTIKDRAAHGLPGTRYWCCFILGRRRSVDDLPLFLALLKDEIPDVREQALHALVMLSQAISLQHALPKIQPLLEDADPKVRKAAQHALTAIGA